MERLKQAQSSVLQTQNSTLTELSSHVENYKNLKTLLENLNQKVSQPCYIPFASSSNKVTSSNSSQKPKCLIKGKLKHTNEILVLLGAGYFAEVSTFTAGKIIDRRIARLQGTVEDFEASQSQINSHQEFTEKFIDEEKDNQNHQEEFENNNKDDSFDFNQETDISDTEARLYQEKLTGKRLSLSTKNEDHEKSCSC